MSRIYQYGYKLVPIYFLFVGILCVGLYWLSYPLFDYAMLGSYLVDVSRSLSFYSNESYNIFNLITGFLLVFLIGIHFALIVGLVVSIYWSEFIRLEIQKKGFNILEIFVKIPLVVYGYLLLFLFSNLINLNDSILQNMLVISLILGGMMLPNIIYEFILILQSIPYTQREGAYSLGASHYRTATMVLIPSKIKLFIASIINITSRALCEMLIVFLIAGFITERLEAILSIFIISITSTILSQWLKKSDE